MTARGCLILLSALGLSMLSGCNKTPKGIIAPDDMARLVADTYMLEGVVDFNMGRYPDDSSRLVLKRSLYARRGFTQQQVDTSLAWYGRHIEEYVKVCDQAIELLKQRQQDLALANAQAISIAGDSVNIWPGASHVVVGANMPTRFLTFDIPADSNWHNGDIYELRYKLINSNRVLNARILVDYNDGVTEYADGKGLAHGVSSLKISVDSTRSPRRLYGVLDFGEKTNESFHIDSLQLVRTRKKLGNSAYVTKRKFKWGDTHRDTVTTPVPVQVASSAMQVDPSKPLPASIMP